jgi:diguanylate cyclase (GGDEF)-like protein
MSILVVDNSPDIRRLLKRFLEVGGYPSVLTASSAREAFHLLETSAAPPVRLVLMDIQMPEMNGIEACRVLRQDERFRELPVLMVTSQPEDQDLHNAFTAGAWDYIRKPVNRSVLLARVQAALRLLDEMEQRRAREAELLRVKHELERVNAELHQQATRDGLTGVANRRRFEEQLAEEWRRAIRMRTPLTLAMIDVDCFKSFNDRYGHQSGDECLRAIARALEGTTRRAGELLARYGGEEFVVVLPGTSAQESFMAARRMLKSVEALNLPHAASSVCGTVTVSIGIATRIPDLGENPNDLLREADAALYRAKLSGRNRFVGPCESPATAPEDSVHA